MRALSAGGIALGIALFVWACAWWVSGAPERRRKRQARLALVMDDVAVEQAREIYLGYDAAVDSIERLLAADEARLFLSEREQDELQGHITNFNRLTRKGIT